MQIYTAGFFRSALAVVGDRTGQYGAFTLETQHCPDSPNQPGFSSTVLRAGQRYQSTTVFRFGVQR